MVNRVYYGEYSLEHWVKLILNKKVILPEYQRNFVWTEDKRRKLIESLEEKNFVPPVIIGSFKHKGITENILIDGQQRLTSILLSVLGFFPDRASFKKNALKHEVKIVDENDDYVDENDGNDKYTDVINWTFNELLEDGPKSLGDIRQELKKNIYFKPLDNAQVKLDDDFLKKTFLGFSYLIPDYEDDNSQQKYYASVFRNINVQGQSLTPQESREALYYLDHSKISFFKPDFLGNYLTARVDFVRYMAILSEFHNTPDKEKLCVGYGGSKEKLEVYYMTYINSVISHENNSDNDRFFSFEDLFNNKDYESTFQNLDNYINKLGLYNQEFESIIDYDMYYFGLIYEVIFKKRKLNLDLQDELHLKLKEKIEYYKMPFLDSEGNPTVNPTNKLNTHPKNPSTLKYITQRVKESVSIYEEVVLENNE